MSSSSTKRVRLATPRLDELIDQLIQRLLQEGYLTVEGEGEDDMGESGDAQRARFRPRKEAGETTDYRKVRVKFEVTAKGLDFLSRL
jgi:hypothetical protein